MTALIATGRILVPYTIDGQTHQVKAYVRNVQAVGASWNINSRTLDENDIPWYDAAHALAESLSYLLDDAATFGTILLQKLVDQTWQPLESTTGTNAHGSSAYYPGAQATMTLRDTSFKQIKVVLIEGITTPGYRYVDPTAGAAETDNFIKQWLPSFTVGVAPYNWQVSRGNRYISANPFVSMVFAMNRKARRRRGIA